VAALMHIALGLTIAAPVLMAAAIICRAARLAAADRQLDRFATPSSSPGPSACHGPDTRRPPNRGGRLPQDAAGTFVGVERNIADMRRSADAEEAAGNLEIASAIRAVANAAEASKQVRLQILCHQTETLEHPGTRRPIGIGPAA
jgi:hypothetical protein